MLAGETPNMPDDAARSRPRHHDAAEPPPVSMAVDRFADDETAASEFFDGPSAEQLAKRFAPQPPFSASVAQQVRPAPEDRASDGSRSSLAPLRSPIRWPPEPHAGDRSPNPYAPPRSRKSTTATAASVDAPPPGHEPRPARAVFAPAPGTARAGDGGRVDPIRWRASDETAGSLLRPPHGTNWSGKVAVVAMVFAVAIGGVVTVVTMESSPAQPAPGVAAADPIPARASDNELSAAAMRPSMGKMITAARGSASGIGVILAEDASIGLAPAERAPSSAKVIPLPQPAAASVDLLPTRDAGSGGDIDGAAIDSRGASVAPPVPSRVAIDQPLTDPVDVTAGGGDSLAEPPLPAPTPRPNHGAAPPKSVLAYAPAAVSADRGAKAIATKGYKPPAIALKPAAARVVSSVNMRASADNKAPIVTALPAGSRVTIVKCKSWCEIVADGKRGFVLQSFLETTARVAKPAVGDRRRDAGASALGNPYLKDLSLY